MGKFLKLLSIQTVWSCLIFEAWSYNHSYSSSISPNIRSLVVVETAHQDGGIGAVYHGDRMNVTVKFMVTGDILGCTISLDYHRLLDVVDSDVAFHNIAVNGSVNHEMDSWQAKYKFGYVDLMNASTAGTIIIRHSLFVRKDLHNIAASGNEMQLGIRTFENHDVSSPSTNIQYRVALLGADVFLGYTLEPSGEIQAGDVLKYVLTVTPQAGATESASDISLDIKIVESDTDVQSASFYNPTTSSNHSLSHPDSTLYTLAVSQLAPSEKILVYLTIRVTNGVLLEMWYAFDVALRYSDQNNPGVRISKSQSLSNPTASINITSPTPLLPDAVLVGELIPLSVEFRMPAGTIGEVSIEIDYSFTGSASNFELVVINSEFSGLQSSKNQRKRRAVSKTVKKSFGKIVNPPSGADKYVDASVTFIISPSAFDASGDLAIVADLVLSTGRRYNILTETISVNPAPLLRIAKRIQMYDTSTSPDTVTITVSLSHSPNSTTKAYSIVLNDHPYPGMMLTDAPGLSPADGEDGLKNYDGKKLRWNVGQMGVSDTKVLTYRASRHFTSNKEVSPNEVLNYMSEVVFKSASNSVVFGPVKVSVCTISQVTMESSIVYEHGFTALAFFLAVIAGFLVVFIVVLICVRFVRRGPFAIIYPVTSVEDGGHYKGKLLLETTKSTENRDFHTITELSTLSADDSIVHIMALKDSLQINREIDSLDIVSTIGVDSELEAERNEARFHATWLLIQSLRINGDITKPSEDRVLQTYQRQYRDMERTLETEYRQKRDALFSKITRKNKDIIEEVETKQKKEKMELQVKSREIFASDKDQDELMSLLRERHLVQRNEVVYKLKLEQDEASEQLRKDFSAQKQMRIPTLHKDLLDEVISEGKLGEQQIEWLMTEQRKNMAAVERMYDEEISRQRMVLEEKLIHRRTVVSNAVKNEEDSNDRLNLMASHLVQTIKQLKKQNVLTPYDAETMVAKVTNDLISLRNKMEKERDSQEGELQKMLSGQKKQKLAEMRKTQEKDIASYDKKHGEQQADSPTDPLSFVGARQQLLSNLRADRSDLEDELDQSNTSDLEKLRQGSREQTRQQIDDYTLQLFDDLKTRGLPASRAAKIMAQHKQEVEDLERKQAAERQRQNDLLLEKLEINRSNLARQHEAEKKEQQLLRQHESELVRSLINGQMSLSEEERDRIMKEHEKNMVKLENCLTLNKLQQKRMLEEKLAQQRAEEMATLEKKQNKEVKTQRSAMEDGDSRSAQVNLMKTHFGQRLAILHGAKFDVDVELEGIRLEMTKERAASLRAQEEALGSLVAALQMDKAREMAKIEEQQRAIYSLQMNMMDDLTDRGVLTDPECLAIIERHKEEQATLRSKLDSQRAKQEKALRERLQKRVELREQAISQNHENAIYQIGQQFKNQNASKIKKVIMIQKQILELEHFRNQMEREVSQALEELKRQFDVRKMAALQEQVENLVLLFGSAANDELQFVKGLVRLGKFRRSELVDVLKLLYPSRNNDEINELLSKIYEKDISNNEVSNDDGGGGLTEKFRSSVLEAVAARPTTTTGGHPSLTQQTTSASLKKRMKKAKKNSEIDELSSSMSTSLRERPEPLGQDRETDDYNEIVEASPTYGRLTPIDVVPASHLPPIQGAGKKKKKGGLKKMVKKRHLDESDDE